MARLLDVALKSGAVSTAAAAIPGGSIALKAVSTASQLLNKVLVSKKERAERERQKQVAKIAAIEGLQNKGLVNRGTDTPDNPALRAVFGSQPTERTGKIDSGTEKFSFSSLTKKSNGKNTAQMEKMDYSELFKKYWYVPVAALAVYFLMGKKRR